MIILSSTSRGLEFWSVNHTSIYENLKLNLFKNIKFLGEISSNWPNNLLGMHVFHAMHVFYFKRNSIFYFI